MKLLAASILICLTLSTLPSFTAAPFDSCSCSADDGSCTVTASCSGGCLAFCPSNGCRAMCTSEGSGGHADSLMRRISLHFKGSNSREVSAELARITGEEVVFSPSTVDATFDLHVDEVPLWNILEILSQSGRIQIGGDDFSNLQTVRRSFLQGERISVCIRGTTIKRLVEELRYLTGLDIQVTSGDRKTVVNFTAKGVNLNEIVAQVSERTGIQITIK